VLLIVRHGESQPARADAPFPLVDGHGDPALAPDGVKQAALVCSRLASFSVDAVYVTPLRRTAQTAAPLLAASGLTASVAPDLVEVDLGEWEGGLIRQRTAEGHPLALRMREEERWDVVPGAESMEHLQERVRRGVLAIAAAHPGERVAVFTHGGVIGQIFAEAARSRSFAFVGADNGSLSELVVAGDRWVVRRFNDTAHLYG
jgi:probable phosphoglycerate mutase